MADNKKKDENKIKKNTSLRDYIEADAYGMSLSKFRKHRKNLDNLTDKIRKFILDKQKTDNSNTNSLDKMFDIVKGSFNSTKLSYDNQIYQNFQTKSGIRSLGEFNTNPEETRLIDLFDQNISNSFVQMNEFRIICSIVPELNKIVQNVTRDILNTNDIHKHFLNNLFKVSQSNGLDQNFVKYINDEIQEKVVKRNNLEKKIKNYVQEALITGAKPVVVIPYSDIYQMISLNMEKSNMDKSKESFDNFMYSVENSNSFYKPSIRERYIKQHQSSLESHTRINSNEKTIYDKIIKDAVEQYYNHESKIYLDNINRSIEFYQTNFSSEDIKIQNKIDDLENIRAKFENPDDDVIKVKKQEIKAQMLNLIDGIDMNIEFVNPVNSAFKMASKALKAGWKVNKLYETTPMEIDVNADIDRRVDDHILEPVDQRFKIHNDLDPTDLLKTDQKQKTTSDKEFDDSLNDVLILDFDPENVIPIIVNGVHVDYYIIEEEAYNSGLERSQKSGFTFMDVVKSLGVNNDTAIAGQGLQNHSLDAGGFGNIPAFGQQINLNTLTTTMSMTAQTDDAIKRNEILREVVMRTISTRLENMDLVDNKIFRDCIMNLLRQGYILKKKVQFTNLPAGNMIYFTPSLTNTGLPKSIYADTLFYCYIYISSLISTLMIKLAKSSNKDKVEFEVAEDNNFALAAHLIDNGLSTRQTHGFNTFDSVFSVLKNSIAHDRILIPLVGGDPLIKYEEMQKMNDISIDDDFTEDMLYKIIQQTSYPAAAMNKLSEEEYAKSIATQNLAYVHDLIEKQEVFGNQVTKLLKLCLRYTKFTPRTKKAIADNMHDFEFAFAIPQDLFIENSNNRFGNIETFADMITKMYFNADMDEESKKAAVDYFRMEVIKSNSNNIDWDQYDDLYKSALSTKTKNELEKIKDTKKFEDTQEKAIGEETDDMGGDMGSMDFGGGDDTGGGDDAGGGFDFGGGGEAENEEEEFKF